MKVLLMPTDYYVLIPIALIALSVVWCFALTPEQQEGCLGIGCCLLFITIFAGLPFFVYLWLPEQLPREYRNEYGYPCATIQWACWVGTAGVLYMLGSLIVILAEDSKSKKK
jgi:hypothetical protein